MGNPQETSRLHRAKERFQGGLRGVGRTAATSKAGIIGIIVYSAGMADGIRLIADQRMGGEPGEDQVIRAAVIGYIGLITVFINGANHYRLLFRERRLSTTPPKNND